jgi:hypothetical protein
MEKGNQKRDGAKTIHQQFSLRKNVVHYHLVEQKSVAHYKSGEK